MYNNMIVPVIPLIVPFTYTIYTILQGLYYRIIIPSIDPLSIPFPTRPVRRVTGVGGGWWRTGRGTEWEK